jgi:hypothetical protein
MIRFIESLGDRILQAVVPKATAAAASTAACQWGNICGKRCGTTGGCPTYLSRYQWCGSEAICLRHSLCGCRTGCPC